MAISFAFHLIITQLAIMKENAKAVLHTAIHKLLLSFFLILFGTAIYAQQVSGTVADSTSKPVSKATVHVKGTSRATTTDDAGNFTINASGNDVLVVTSVGFTRQEVPVNGNRFLNITMAADIQNMEAIVVTALGIRKEARKLGYSATTAKLDEMQQNRTNNVVTSLEGKIAGLDIAPPSAGPASSNKIRIRGQSAFAGADNGPLIVINGLPMSQGAAGASGGGGADNASRDRGDNFLLVNPDDIESMTVLKGATAAALYGSRASNGAIIITTKSGARNTGIGVELTSGVNIDEVLDLTDYQMEFGQGDVTRNPATNILEGTRPGVRGITAAGTGQFGWGERYDGVPTIQFDGVLRPYSPASKSRIKDFFNTGITYNNTVALSGGGPKGSFRVSYSQMDAKGITPANEYKRKIFNLGLNQNLSDKLSVSVNINYTNDKNFNAPQVGVQGQGYMNFIVRTSPVVPLSAFRNAAANAVGAETPTNGFGATVLNPYFYIPRQFNRNRGDRLLGTVSTKYQLLKWLYLQGRVAVNYDVAHNERNNPTGGGGFGTANLGIYYDNTRTTYNGTFDVDQSQSKDINYDFILGGNKEFGDFSVDFGFSGNRRTNVGRGTNVGSEAFLSKDVYTIGNGTVFRQGNGFSQFWVNSLLGWGELGWRNMLFLNVTGRTDWYSVLNPEFNKYFYPSVSGSFIFTELFKDKPQWLGYGKLRASWADVGQLTNVGPYYFNVNYSYSTQQYLGRTIASVGGNVPNPQISPYSLQEKEIGLELKMFDNRLNTDVAVYHKKTTDQILNVLTSTASGTGSVLQNVASLENKGFEFLIDATPVRTRNFSWNSSFNTAYNISKVLSLGGLKRLTVIDWYNNGASNEFMGKQIYEVGKPLAQIAARTYLRNANGDVLLTSAGRLIGTPTDTLFGSALPKWTGGWNNTFRYKGLNLLVHFDYKAGGKFISGSALNALRQGHSKASLVGRRPGENGVVFPGVYRDGPNAGKPNTSAVFGKDFYTDYRGQQIADPFVYKSDYIKLRNITLSYDFTAFIGSQVKFVKGLMLSLSCRNVAIIKKYVPDIDPEQVASTSDLRAGYEAVALPTTRTWGANINVKF
jgi:TonB-linked SusC/RagA family outer membrane protein